MLFRSNFIPMYTPLTCESGADEIVILNQICEIFPDAMLNREVFVAKMGEIYDRGSLARAEGSKTRKRLRSTDGHKVGEAVDGDGIREEVPAVHLEVLCEEAAPEKEGEE